MASLSPSPVPSSSAVTIQIPGKSILKHTPQSQQSFFSRIKGFLPTQSPNSSNETKPLKRAHFILPQIATIYPISSVNPPSTPTLKEEKKAIEEREAERRKRVVRGNSIGPGLDETEEWWNMDKVDSFYRECCASREEQPDPAITAAFKVSNVHFALMSSNPKPPECVWYASSFCGSIRRTVDCNLCRDPFRRLHHRMGTSKGCVP